jgi:hypothetical protein
MEMTSSNPLGADAAGGGDLELGAELESLKASHADLAKKVALLGEAGASTDVKAIVAKMGAAPTNWHQVRTLSTYGLGHVRVELVTRCIR